MSIIILAFIFTGILIFISNFVVSISVLVVFDMLDEHVKHYHIIIILIGHINWVYLFETITLFYIEFYTNIQLSYHKIIKIVFGSSIHILFSTKYCSYFYILFGI